MSQAGNRLHAGRCLIRDQNKILSPRAEVGGKFKGKGHFSGQSAHRGKGRGAKGSGRS